MLRIHLIRKLRLLLRIGHGLILSSILSTRILIDKVRTQTSGTSLGVDDIVVARVSLTWRIEIISHITLTR